MHRFLGSFLLSKGFFEIKNLDQVHQISRVLKLKVGESICIGDGHGKQGRGRIIKVTKSSVELDIENIEQRSSDSEICSVLYASLLKKENFDLVIQKAVEVGVSEIVPIITDRTIKTGLKIDRWRTIIHESSEQSGRFYMPSIVEPMRWSDAVSHCKNNDINYFFDMSGEDARLGLHKNRKRAGIFIGPEGGWSDREIDDASRAGMKIVNLSSGVLRAETASIIATYLVTNQ